MQDEEKLARKLKRNPAALLTGREVKLMVAAADQMWRDSFPHIADLPSLDFGALHFEDLCRWSSLGARCRQAREAMGLDLKEAAAASRVPRYRAQAVEHGSLRELRPDLAMRYFEFLGIVPWVRRWCKTNTELARRAGIVPSGLKKSSQRQGLAT